MKFDINSLRVKICTRMYAHVCKIYACLFQCSRLFFVGKRIVK